jgi:transcriptional regulator with XRE-family HTH domain
MSKLSTLLREAREAKGWTLAELADRSKVPIQTISRYQNPNWKGAPDIANVIRLVDKLEIPDDQWTAAINIPLRRSESAQERDERYNQIVALVEGDPRFETVAEMWKTGGDEEKETAIAILETVFKRKRPPVARRRLRVDRDSQQ